MENNENNVTNNTTNNEEEVLKTEGAKSKKFNTIIIIVIILLIISISAFAYFAIVDKKDSTPKKEEVKSESKYSEYRLSGNSLEEFDLYFLKLENEKENKVYSPLSIKYALGMLNEGTSGESKEQVSNILGTYNSKKYINSENMSFANALFIRDLYKDDVKDSYVNTISNKYNAEVFYDSFATPDVLNSWVSDKTFNLIDNMYDDISEHDFILVNSLAIDMEWVNKIQSEHEDYIVNYAHEKFSSYISALDCSDYSRLEFKDLPYKAKAVEFGAVINKYDIVNVLGEDNIRETVKEAYKKWQAGDSEYGCGAGSANSLDVDSYLDKYIKEINQGYKDISSSTDFSFHVDDNVKVFAKDLKEYNGTTLQYIGIMPKNENLDNYISNIKASDINNLINELKTIELNNFKDGVITEVYGYIPMFKFDYELNLMDDLKKLGVTDIFDPNKADLSNLTKEDSFINDTSHKANIEFSNEGIKAAATTAVGGKGNASCEFDYLYDVPVEKIDLTFDNPYLFLIRDKDSGEVWFVGTVYEPIEFHSFYE